MRATVMERTRRLTTNVAAGVRPGSGPMNWFAHLRAFPPGDFREVVRPNYDTLYSLLWNDLRDGPLVISVPGSDRRAHTGAMPRI
jgi:hypothetical protein